MIPNFFASAPVLSKISDPGFKKWAEQLNSYWKILGRKVCRHQSLQMVRKHNKLSEIEKD